MENSWRCNSPNLHKTQKGLEFCQMTERFSCPSGVNWDMFVYLVSFGWCCFQVVSLPARIDPLQTSAVVSLHGRLYVRVPFEKGLV